MLNFINVLFVFIFILKYIACEENKTILDYKSLYLPFSLNNETLKEVYLGFEQNSRILAYIDFKSTKNEKA